MSYQNDYIVRKHNKEEFTLENLAKNSGGRE